MKRIGIFTFHRSINYGAFMQAYSLSRKLSSSFPDADVEIIDYTSRIMSENQTPKINMLSIKHPVGYFLSKKQYALFKKSIDRLPLSAKSICSDGETESVLATYENDYDIFVVGSDAVWNWCRRGFPNPYLMNFEKDVVKMSYAASAYGMDSSYIGKEEAAYFADSLKKFSFIGVRDDYTGKLVHNVCPSAHTEFTGDPTVFLNLDDVYAEIGVSKEEFRKRIYKRLGIGEDKKLIGLMGVPKEVVRKIKSRYGNKYVLVNLYKYSRFADKQLVDLTPFEWAAVFSLFEVTVTSYFHGTLLSLCNYTPVVNFDFSDFSKKNEGKICDVMRRADLSNCHFKNRSDYDLIVDRVADVIENRESYVEKIKKNIALLEQSSNLFIDKVGEFLR